MKRNHKLTALTIISLLAISAVGFLLWSFATQERRIEPEVSKMWRQVSKLVGKYQVDVWTWRRVGRSETLPPDSLVYLWDNRASQIVGKPQFASSLKSPIPAHTALFMAKALASSEFGHELPEDFTGTLLVSEKHDYGLRQMFNGRASIFLVVIDGKVRSNTPGHITSL